MKEIIKHCSVGKKKDWFNLFIPPPIQVNVGIVLHDSILFWHLSCYWLKGNLAIYSLIIIVYIGANYLTQLNCSR